MRGLLSWGSSQNLCFGIRRGEGAVGLLSYSVVFFLFFFLLFKGMLDLRSIRYSLCNLWGQQLRKELHYFIIFLLCS